MKLTTFFEAYNNYLLKCIRMYGVPEQDCQDVLGEVYSRMWEKQIVIRPTGIKGFCATLARNAAYSYLRKLKNEPCYVQIDDEAFKEGHPSLNNISMKQWSSIIDNPNASRIEEALELAKTYEVQPDLTAFQLIADIMVGLTHEQIGEMYGVQRVTVSRWITGWHRWIKEKMTS